MIKEVLLGEDEEDHGGGACWGCILEGGCCWAATLFRRGDGRRRVAVVSGVSDRLVMVLMRQGLLVLAVWTPQSFCAGRWCSSVTRRFACLIRARRRGLSTFTKRLRLVSGSYGSRRKI